MNRIDSVKSLPQTLHRIFYESKTLRWVFIFIYSIQILAPIGLIPEAFASSQPKSTSNQATKFTPEERIDLRGPHTKITQTGEKTFSAEITQQKIHYGTPGNYKEVNNNIVKVGEGKYPFRNTANDFNIWLGEDLSTGFKYQGDRGICEFKLDSAAGVDLVNSTIDIDQNVARYPDIYQDADLEITVFSEGFTTEIVAETALAQKESYDFELTDCNEEIFNEPTIRGNNREAKANSSTKINNGKKIFKVTPDYSLLGSFTGETRIDPDILNISQNRNVFASSKIPNGHVRRFLTIGNFYDTTSNDDYGRNQTYLRFLLNELETGAIILNSYVTVHKYANAGASFTAKASGLTQSFTELTGKSLNDWKTRGSVEDSKVIDSGDYDWDQINFNITDLTTDWYTGARPNYGVALYSTNAGYRSGAAVCSSRSDGFCTNETAPNLHIDYVINQPPNTPGIVSPTNLSTFGGTCDESSATPTNCRTNTDITFELDQLGDGDPAPGDFKGTEIQFTSTSVDTTTAILSGQPTLSHTQALIDGIYNWKARSKDNYGIYGNWSVVNTLTTDTTPPGIPELSTLQEFTRGVEESPVQLETTTTAVTDNTSQANQIKYQIEYSTTPDFTQSFSKPFQFSNTFEIGSYGADGTQNTPDDILNETTYFLRSKSKDALGNISEWGTPVSTTIDGTLPTSSALSLNLGRFSPNNSTSIGVKDSITVDLTFNELHPKTADLSIYSPQDLVNPVRTISQDLAGYEGQAGDIPIQFTWDGKDNLETFVSDGAYTLKVEIEDKAGNINSNVQTEIATVDNNEANISISSPLDNSWTNLVSLPITGQVMSPNDANEEDQDLEKLQIREIDGSWLTVIYNALGIYSQTVALSAGENVFTLKTTDAVGNTGEMALTINRDSSPVLISDIVPNTKMNERMPTISFTATDQDPTGDRSQTSDIPYGTNPEDINVWITYLALDNGELKTLTKELIEDGVNHAPELIDNLVCTPEGSASTSTKNNIEAASEVECSIAFNSELQPDSKYTIHIELSDTAGNTTLDEATTFTLDSHVYNTVQTPIPNSVYSSSSILFKGTATKGDELTIINDNLNETRSYTLDESLDGTSQDSFLTSDFRVTCGIWADIDDRPDTQDQEVCDWEVWVAQEYLDRDQDTINANRVVISDEAGNLSILELPVIVNLYNFDLTIKSDYTYFSPNGDGRQDTINFYHSATNPTDPLAPPNIATYEVMLRDNAGNTVRTFSGTDFIPAFTFFDGKIIDQSAQTEKWIWLPDGEYSYTIKATTNEGAIVETDTQPIYAKTTLKDELVITTPQTGDITTNGVLTIQGQAPTDQPLDGEAGILHGEVTVKLCIDAITNPNDVQCDSWANVQADENGFFTTLMAIPLTSLSQTEFLISGVAQDEYGNQTSRSNIVSVHYDILDPFTSISITPTLTGVTTEEDYQKFLNGEISIDQIRALKLSATVSENTEYVEFSFASLTNLNERPETPIFGYIGLVNDLKETNALLNPFDKESVKENHNLIFGDSSIPSNSCTEPQGCTWEYLYPAYDLSGIYEIKFKGKKSDVIQELHAGFTADNTLPAAPVFMIVEKWDDVLNDWVELNNFSNTMLTDGGTLRFRGAAQPGTYLEFMIGTITAGSMVVPDTGIFEFIVDLDPYLKTDPGNENGNGQGLECREWKTGEGNERKCIDGDLEVGLIGWEIDENGNYINPVESDGGLNIKYDEVLPTLLTISRSGPSDNRPGWVQTGDNATYSFVSSEALRYSSIIKEDNFTRLLSNQFENIMWAGNINVDTKHEGYYEPQIKLVDTAENENIYDSALWETYGLGDFRLYVDNTSPDSTEILKNSWSTNFTQGGINADGVYPELGRTNPDYVVRAGSIQINGQAEKGQRVELYMNGEFAEFIEVSNDNCSVAGKDNITKDGLLVKSGEVCDYSYTYTFPGDGKSGDVWGVSDQGYIMQVRTIDNAGNRSDWSTQEIVYHDTKAPFTPEFNKIVSPSYSPIPGWERNGSNGITRDTKITVESRAERFADMQYLFTTPKGASSEKFFINDADMDVVKGFDLGSQSDDRAGCVTTVNKRRIGTCEDGKYAIKLTSTDAAGNRSNTGSIKVERDTVKPAKAQMYIVANDFNHTVSLQVSAEPGTKAILNSTRTYTIPSSGSLNITAVSGGYWEYGTKYIFKLSLTDRAGNISDATYAEYTTPMPSVLGAYACIGGNEAVLDYPFEENHPISSYYGYRDLDGDGNKTDWHPAIDFSMPTGTNILAAEDGKVVYRDDNRATGVFLIVHHPELGINTMYLHSDSNLVKVGHNVEQGMHIAESGNTGYSTGPHLHFETRTGGPGTDFDPLTYLSDCEQDKETDLPIEVIENKFTDFIDKYLDDDSKIKNVDTGEEVKVGDFDSTYDALSTNNWCGTEVQEFGRLYENDGGSSFHGALILNNYSNSVVLVKGAVWTKYKDMGGPCSEIGVPQYTNGHYTEKDAGIRYNSSPFGHKPHSAKYQRFETKSNKKNSIYWYAWDGGDRTYATMGRIANRYEEAGGSTGRYDFPVTDKMNKVSECGTSGQRQRFGKGRIYKSRFGTYAFEKDTFLQAYYNRGEIEGELGWPKSEKYYDYSRLTNRAEFEQGTLFKNAFSEKVEMTDACLSSERDNDKDRGATDEVINAIHVKEDQIFADFDRADNSNGIPHSYCGGWVVDYKSTTLKDQSVENSSWILYKEGYGAKYMTHDIGMTYWNNGGCNQFGFPTTDTRETNANNGDYQTFRKSDNTNTDIYWHNWREKAQGHWVSGDTRAYYNNLDGAKGVLGYPTNEQKFNTSDCGTQGYHQEFQSGKTYVSGKGNVYMKYGWLLDSYWAADEVTGQLGWPLPGHDWEGSVNKTRRFESGELTARPLVGDTTKALACSNADERDRDTNSDAPQSVLDVIYEKEESEFTNFLRKNGPNGAVHSFCGGWIVDYSSVDYKNGETDDGVYIVANKDGTKAYVMSGEIAQKYWADSGCSQLGLPTTDRADAGQNKSYGFKAGYSYVQRFAKGDIYNYEAPRLLGTDVHVYIITGVLKEKYDASNDINGAYAFPTSDRYRKYDYLCQDFDGGKICNTVGTTQEKIRVKEFSLSGGTKVEGIKTMCSKGYQEYSSLGDLGKSIIIVVNGEAIVMSGDILDYFTTEGGCQAFGLPTGDREAVSGKNANGYMQSFEALSDKVRDIYSPSGTYNTYHIQGEFKDEYEKRGGIEELGFIRDISPTSITTCDSTAVFWGIENGRIYKLSNNNYNTVIADTKIGTYFFAEGANKEFGVPMNDWSGDTWGEEQKFEKTDMSSNFFGVITESDEGRYCPGEEPDPPTDPQDPPVASCGNAEKEEGETCDDGNTEDGDSCSSDCKLACSDDLVAWNGECVESLSCYASSDMLPWPGGVKYQVSQDQLNTAPKGSHKPDNKWNQYALDFSIGIGGEINSISSGEVLFSKYNSSKHGTSVSYGDYANMVLIKNTDGSVSQYLHLKKDSGDLLPGDIVQRGEKVGEVGLSGFTYAAHLHYGELVESSLYTKNNKGDENYAMWGTSASSLLFGDQSTCNPTYKGIPKYYNPDTVPLTQDYFNSHNYLDETSTQ